MKLRLALKFLLQFVQVVNTVEEAVEYILESECIS